MSYAIKTPSTQPPVSLDTIKKHVRIDHSDDDDMLLLYAEAARERWEEQTGYVLMSQTWKCVLDDFPNIPLTGGLYANPISLHKHPVSNINSITYRDPTGENRTLAIDSVHLDFDSRPCRVAPRSSRWPLTDRNIGAVSIEFVAGVDNQSLIPKVIQIALLMMISHWYEHREEASEVSLSVVPSAVRTIMNLYLCREQ